MRVIGLMAWFDEPVEFLTRAIRSAAESGVDEIVAVDGAYAMLPDAQPGSDPRQTKAILSAARKAGIAVTVHVPAEPWETEMAKRERLFALGYAVARPYHDWFFVIDADYEIRGRDRRWRDALETVTEEVAMVRAHTPPGPNGATTFGPSERADFRMLYRAQRITLAGNHYTYVGEGNRFLWGHGQMVDLVPAADLAELLEVKHWTYYRPKDRNRRQYDYYRARDRANVERGDCVRCGEPATAAVPSFAKNDRGGVDAFLVETCDGCQMDLIREGRRLADEWKLDDMVAGVGGGG